MPKVILITGAAKRLGQLLALDLANQGNSVAIHYHRSQKEAKSLLKKILEKNQKASIFTADLTNISEIESMVAKILKRFGKIDVLINNAAIFYETPFGHIQERDWDAFLDTNLKGPFFCAQAVARQMLKQKGPPRVGPPQVGSKNQFKIINIADSGGPKTRAHYLPYWISKAGLMAMTETLAKILTPRIGVNTIAPGPILFPKDRKRLKNQMPIPPSEIIKAVRYLINDATYLTGNTLIIDGGRRYR